MTLVDQPYDSNFDINTGLNTDLVTFDQFQFSMLLLRNSMQLYIKLYHGNQNYLNLIEIHFQSNFKPCQICDIFKLGRF